MLKINNKEDKTLELYSAPLSIQIRKAIKRKKLSRSMQGLRALRMGEGFSFRPLENGKESFSQMGGGLGSFLKKQVMGNINHIGINGLVEVTLLLNQKGVVDEKKSQTVGESKELCRHVWNYLVKKNNLNRPFWENLARSKKIKIKLFFLDSINTRDLASIPGEKTYISGDELLVFVYKSIRPYNYSNSINLMNL
jgi:hypothetical protein